MTMRGWRAGLLHMRKVKMTRGPEQLLVSARQPRTRNAINREEVGGWGEEGG